MTETHQVELEFLRATVKWELEIGVLANDDVVVECARTEVVNERDDLSEFQTGRVIA